MPSKRSRLVIDPEIGQIHRVMPNGEIRANVGSLDATGYMRINVGGKALHVHRLIYEFVHGPIAGGLDIDHANENKTDNRIANLRALTRSQNMQNTRSARAGAFSRHKGVSFCKMLNKWRAQITVNYKMKYLGAFDTEEDAADFYGLAASLVHTHNPVSAGV